MSNDWGSTPEQLPKSCMPAPAPTWKYPIPTQPVISPPSIELRDWFAGMAMQALVTGYTSNQRGFNPREFAILAYGMADEMIKEGAIK